MKRALLFVAASLLFPALSAGHQADVASLRINACDVVRGDVVLTIRVLPAPAYDQASNSCEVDGQNVKLTFWVPTYIPQR